MIRQEEIGAREGAHSAFSLPGLTLQPVIRTRRSVNFSAVAVPPCTAQGGRAQAPSPTPLRQNDRRTRCSNAHVRSPAALSALNHPQPPCTPSVNVHHPITEATPPPSARCGPVTPWRCNRDPPSGHGLGQVAQRTQAPPTLPRSQRVGAGAMGAGDMGEGETAGKAAGGQKEVEIVVVPPPGDGAAKPPSAGGGAAKAPPYKPYVPTAWDGFCMLMLSPLFQCAMQLVFGIFIVSLFVFVRWGWWAGNAGGGWLVGAPVVLRNLPPPGGRGGGCLGKEEGGGTVHVHVQWPPVFACQPGQAPPS